MASSVLPKILQWEDVELEVVKRREQESSLYLDKETGELDSYAEMKVQGGLEKATVEVRREPPLKWGFFPYLQFPKNSKSSWGKWNNGDDYGLIQVFFLLKMGFLRASTRKNAPAAELSHADKVPAVFSKPFFLIFRTVCK